SNSGERRPRTVSGAALVATPLRSEPRSGLVLALQAPTATLEEAVIAELLLGQVVMAADRLVVELPGRARRRTEDVSAFVAVLEAIGVIPAGHGVRVGPRLHYL